MGWGRVEVTAGFLLVVALANFLDGQGLVPLALLACLCHELGHYIAICLLGGRVRRVRLTAVGAVMSLERGMSYLGELLAALAGPGANLLLAALLCRWEVMALFAGMNLMLGLFNLLPVGRLDGGRAVRCVTGAVWGPQRADQIARYLDLGLMGLLTAGGVLALGRGGSFTLLLTALWLAGSAIRKEKPGKRGCHTGRKQVE